MSPFTASKSSPPVGGQLIREDGRSRSKLGGENEGLASGGSAGIENLSDFGEGKKGRGDYRGRVQEIGLAACGSGEGRSGTLAGEG